jgi:hypothetical protein
LHGVLIAAVYFGLPHLKKDPPRRVTVIPVEMVDIGEKTIAKKQPKKINTTRKPKEAPKKKKKAPESKVAENKPKISNDAVPKITPRSKPKPPKKKKITQVTPKAKPKAKHKKKKFNLGKISALLDKRVPKKSFGDKLRAKGSDEDKPLVTMDVKKEQASLIDAIRIHLRDNRCWSMLTGAADAENMIIFVEVRLRISGELRGVPSVEDARGGKYLQAEEAAVRAVRKCAPYDFLPKDKYTLWENVILRFDQAEALRN